MDEEDEEEDDDGFVDNEIEDREKEFSAAFERRLAAHEAKRAAARKEFEEKWNPEAEEERLRQLYGRAQQRDFLGSREDVGAAAETLAHVLQPHASDPKLWLVKCRPGKERAAVAALMRGLNILGDPMGVYSVIGRDSLKGYIYVEAHKVNEVMNAVQKTRTNHMIFASPINKPVMVPLSEMADVLSAGLATGTIKGTIDPSTLHVGAWVRVRRGKYSGDLAQIIEVDQENTGEGMDYIVRVKLLPRLSYRGMGGGGGNKKDRPSARPFDPQEASQYGSVTKARGFWIFNAEAYKDGFLFKDVRVSSLSLGDVAPRPDELESFGALSISGHHTKDSVADATLIKLAKGENVLVVRGEFQHMTGVVDAAPDGDMVSVRLDDSSAFKDPVLVRVKHLTRRLAVGDTVKVIAGEHVGRSGMIVSVTFEDGKKQAVLFSVVDSQQLIVPFNYIAGAIVAGGGPPEKGSLPKGGDGSSSFELHDLVTLEGEEGDAAIILRLEEHHAFVLDSNSQTRRVALKSLCKVPKPLSQGASRFDPAVIKSTDRVQFVEAGFPDGRPATVLHVHRTHAFLRAIDTGDVVCRPLTTVSRPTAYAGVYASSREPREARNGHGGGGPMRHMIGKSVTISGAGPYKGYIGIVKDLTDTHARIELHTNSKVVTVPRERVSLPGTDAAASGRRPLGSVAGSGGKTPAWAESRTPAWGASKTPAWGSSSSSKTPTWNAQAGGKTPAWGGASAKTPAWGGAAAKTPAWGSTSSAKTPAWGVASSKTPSWGSGSSRTPALGSGSKTPTWQASGPQAQSYLPTWAVQDAEVSLKSGGVGKILSVIPSSGAVQLAGHTAPLSVSEMMPIAPGKKDSVRLLGDDHATGTVIGLDGPDAVIRVDGTSDFRIVPISGLVKIVR